MTLPAFEAQVDALVEQTGARTMGICHLVDAEDRSAWENYTVANQGWTQETLDYHGINETARPIMPFLWGTWRPPFLPVEGPVENYDYYAPLWQGYGGGAASNFDCLR